jgi:hypothetical protein
VSHVVPLMLQHALDGTPCGLAVVARLPLESMV